MTKAEDTTNLTDEFKIEMNPVDTDDGPTSPQLPEIPARPADSASVADWVTYCVSLGADEKFLTDETKHWDGELTSGRLMAAPSLDKKTLIKLADHLGG